VTALPPGVRVVVDHLGAEPLQAILDGDDMLAAILPSAERSDEPGFARGAVGEGPLAWARLRHRAPAALRRGVAYEPRSDDGRGHFG
jgi:hypothetical protein